MKKYAIGKFDLFDGVCTVIIVEAMDGLEAIKIGIENDKDTDLYSSVEEALNYYANCDMPVSEPVEI